MGKDPRDDNADAIRESGTPATTVPDASEGKPAATPPTKQ